VGQQQQHPRQSLLTGIKELIYQILIACRGKDQETGMKNIPYFCSHTSLFYRRIIDSECRHYSMLV
jgi:tRNA isopentenyl-2-thiomethyl-A-37 hydroxylase MiaE